MWSDLGVGPPRLAPAAHLQLLAEVRLDGGPAAAAPIIALPAQAPALLVPTLLCCDQDGMKLELLYRSRAVTFT